jgi:diguanylate cyclase (GGDEF)-like protein
MNLPLAVAFIDIDAFKSVNDRHGHLAGDGVLRRVAELLRSEVRGSDLVCRWGGEEFVWVAPGVRVDDLGILGEKLRERVGVSMATWKIPVSVSVGVAAAESAELDALQLLAAADAALYRAKINGRNRVEVAF